MPPKPEFREVYGDVWEVDGQTVDGQSIIPLQHPAAILHDISIKSTLVRNYRTLQVFDTRLSKKSKNENLGV